MFDFRLVNIFIGVLNQGFSQRNFTSNMFVLDGFFTSRKFHWRFLHAQFFVDLWQSNLPWLVSPLRIGLFPFQMASMAYKWGLTNHLTTGVILQLASPNREFTTKNLHPSVRSRDDFFASRRNQVWKYIAPGGWFPW